MSSVLLLPYTFSQFFYKLTKHESCPDVTIVESWIKAIAKKLGIIVHYTKRLHDILVNRAVYVKRQNKVLTGGAPRRKFMQKQWELQFQCDEIVTEAEMTPKSDLREATDKLEEMKAENIRLQETVERISDKLKQASPGITPRRGRDRTRSLEDFSDRHQRRLKRHRTHACNDSLEWLKLEGYTPTKLEVMNNKTGMTETLTLNREEAVSMLGADVDSLTEDERDVISMMLYVKDRYSVSKDAYHQMARICKGIPREYLLRQRIAELNKQWNIRPTPNGVCGVQQSLEDRLCVRIVCLHQQAPPNAAFYRTKTVNVKLSGDGMNIGKRLHVVNFTFTLLEEGRLAYSSEGNHTLAIFKEPEKYEKLRDALEDIRNEVERLKLSTVEGRTYHINYHLRGDWKFLALVRLCQLYTLMYLV